MTPVGVRGNRIEACGAFAEKGTLGPVAIVKVLHQRWKIVLAVAAGIFLPAAGYAWLASPIYTATARLIIDVRGLKVLNIDDVLPSLDGDTSSIESQVEVLRSRRIAERVLRAHQSLLERSARNGRRLEQEELLEAMMKRLKVERRGLSHIIDVSFRDEDRTVSARIANAFVDEYLADQTEAKQRAAREAHSWLQNRVSEMSRKLRIAEERAERYRVENGLTDTGDLKLGERELTDFTVQLVQARVAAAASAARLQQFEEWAKSPERLTSFGLALDSELIVDLRKQLVESERKIASITSRFGDQHPAALDARAEMEAVVTNIRQELERLVTKARSDAELARAQVTLMEQDLEALKRAYAERKLAAIGYGALAREVEATREFYEALLKRLNETQAQESLQSPDARLVAYAAPPLKPSSPRTSLVMACAALGAFLLGGFAALVLDARGAR